MTYQSEHTPLFETKPYYLIQGKLEKELSRFKENSIDACITDPPYNLGFMGKEWDNIKLFQRWVKVRSKAIFRVLKPGAYFVAFGGSRTHHRLMCGIEDAGFEIRDVIMWVYSTGFPKSYNGEWGGTALKPAYEPIVIARKPLEGNTKTNFEKYGTAGINIDAGRIEGEPWRFGTQTDISGGGFGSKRPADGYYHAKNVVGGENGRWPANLIHDGSEEVLALFPQSKGQQGDVVNVNKSKESPNGIFGKFAKTKASLKRNDVGSAARFFYCAKTSRSDRNEGCEHLEEKPSGMVSNTSGQHMTRRDGYQPPKSSNNHPTVKPTDLMRYLVKMFCPKGGIVLDPFQGSGSTGKAAIYEHCKYIGIDMDFDIAIAQARIEYALRNRSTQLGMDL